LQVQLLG